MSAAGQRLAAAKWPATSRAWTSRLTGELSDQRGDLGRRAAVDPDFFDTAGRRRSLPDACGPARRRRRGPASGCRGARGGRSPRPRPRPCGSPSASPLPAGPPGVPSPGSTTSTAAWIRASPRAGLLSKTETTLTASACGVRDQHRPRNAGMIRLIPACCATGRCVRCGTTPGRRSGPQRPAFMAATASRMGSAWRTSAAFRISTMMRFLGICGRAGILLGVAVI